MFTGLIEEVGKVFQIRQSGDAARVTVECPLIAKGTNIGDSIAINGVCLTVVSLDTALLTFDAVPETMRRTNLGQLHTGSPVNLERALAAGQRMGGHFVQGHIDGVGTVASVRSEDNAHIFFIKASKELMRYIVPKGSVAIDGVSLTVVDVEPNQFSMWIIPHTFENTTFKIRQIGDVVNLETDLLAKYVEKMLLGSDEAENGLSIEKLRDAGYI